MVLETRMICPRSWKCLLLFSQKNIEFKQQHITLNDEILKQIKHPIIDGKDEFSHIFPNFSNLAKKEELEEIGYIFDEIECFFIPEIILPIRHERVVKPLVFRSLSNVENLNGLRENLKKSLISYSKKLEKFEWYSKTEFGYSDITMSTAIAVLDYLGEMPWQLDEIKPIYLWYIKIKSKNSFKIILNESCPGLKPFIKFNQIDF